MIDPDDIKAGYTLGHADAQILRDAITELLALRKAFSEPVAYTAQSNLDGFGGSVGYMWPPGNEKPTDIPLYRKPPTE